MYQVLLLTLLALADAQLDCPDPATECEPDPCLEATCPRFLTADCEANLCHGLCTANFMWKGRNVTDRCAVRMCNEVECPGKRICVEKVHPPSCPDGKPKCRQYIKTSCAFSPEVYGWSTELVQLLESKWPDIEEDTIKLLQKLIQTDTQNLDEEGSETLAALVIKEKFDEVGISYEIVTGKEGRGNIIGRISGDGSSGLGAVLLNSHLDTVRVPKENWEEEGWKYNPFGGVIDEEEGTMYGVGAVDMKYMAAMSVTLLCYVKRSGITLSRDLIFAGVADEESLAHKWGVQYLVKNRPELIEADIVFSEAGGFSFYFGNTEVFTVQIAEKGMVQITISITGPGGHGSLYHEENPIATIGEVAYKLHTKRLPLRTNIANRAFIESIASILPPQQAFIFRRLLNANYSDLVLNSLPPELSSTLGPILHNLANPTIISGGEQHNQIPTSATLQVDARILPETTVEELTDEIKDVLGRELFEPQLGPNGQELPPKLKMDVLFPGNATVQQDPTEPEAKEVIDIIREVISNRADGAPLLSAMIPARTDFPWYVQHPTKRPICLGFTPLRMPPDLQFTALIHAVNERISVEGVKWGVRTLTEVICKLCGCKLE